MELIKGDVKTKQVREREREREREKERENHACVVKYVNCCVFQLMQCFNVRTTSIFIFIPIVK